MTLDMETATHCTRCKRNFRAVTRDGHRIGVYHGDVCKEVICPNCQGEERVAKWQENRELSSGLVSDALSATMYVDEYKDTSRLQRCYALLFERHIAVYREVMADYNEVDEACQLAEIAVWFGRPDRANMETKRAAREFGNQWHDRYLLQKEGKTVPKFDLTPGPLATKTYYEKSPSASHSYTHADYKIMMCGSAGRVLVTIQDSRKQSDPESKFGGAILTVIYDESSDYPRGGIQSHVGTKKELLGLIEAYRSPELNFQPDSDVRIA
jgi:hypothetical protein